MMVADGDVKVWGIKSIFLDGPKLFRGLKFSRNQMLKRETILSSSNQSQSDAASGKTTVVSLLVLHRVRSHSGPSTVKRN